MREREQGETPFYQYDEAIGHGRFFAAATPIRLLAHVADEPYNKTGALAEIVPLTQKRGTRSYVLAQPYVPVAQLKVTMQLFDQPRDDGAIGHVVRSEQVGTRKQPIGKAQGWYYPADRTLVLWEAFLHRPYCRRDDPDDPNLHELWSGFEGFVLRRFPQAQRIATPSWEPIYDADGWHAFLAARGYSRWNERAFGKKVT